MLPARPLPLPLAVPRPGAGACLAVAAWAALVVLGHLLASALLDADHRVHIGAPPLVGGFDLRFGAALLPAVALGAAAVAWAPVLAARLRWAVLLGCAWAGATGWAVALAAGDGLAALSAPLQTRFEYLAAVGLVEDPQDFLSSYTDVLATYPTHVKGHPPGMVLVLWALDAIGLGGAEAAAVLVVGAGALVAPAALVALRACTGEAAARRAAPFLVLAPAAVWVATSADALFAGVAAVGIATFAVAVHRPSGGATPGLAAGVILGGGLLLSYSIAPLGLLVLVLAVARRAWRALAAASAGVAAVLLAAGLAGFWWPDGLLATRELYAEGVSMRRPYADFLAVNLGAFALAVGPVALIALARLRDRGAWLLAGGALAALSAAELSGLSRGEVERIWLPFVPWILVATVALRAPARGWLAAQVALALVVQAGVRSPW